jgi:uncharacterized protein (PEP-CTERM system associated)
MGRSVKRHRTRERRMPWMRGAGIAASMLLVRLHGAEAFPLVDADAAVPRGTDLAAPDALDLKHQLQLVNGLGAPAGGGWTFVPRVDFQEELTDNVFQVHSPRTYDLVSYFAPGFSLVGDLPRIQLAFNYAPTLAIYTRASSLNALTQQMNGIANITVLPDLAFIDVRALAGVHNQNGGIGGQGGIGAPAGAAATPQAAIPNLGGNAQGLNRNNEVQTASFGVSPYVQHRFGDWGMGRMGYSLDVTRSNQLSGFASAPFPTGGTNGQTLVTNEQTAHFVSGDILGYFQDSLDIDLSQTQTTTETGFVNGFTGAKATAPTHTRGTRQTITDQVSYEVNRSITVFASGGHEDIVYTGANGQSIHGATWSVGTTLTPNPDSALTVSYGHQNGTDSFSANGHYVVTARTTMNVSYGTTVGTQLENLQNQLNLATANNNGTLVNGQTGGQLFTNTNALAQQEGVFRTTTLTVGTNTQLDRDIISFNLSLAKQTQTGAAATGTSTNSRIGSASWLHQMRPDMVVSAAFSLSQQEQAGGRTTGFGNLSSYSASLAWQYQISDTVSTNLRYSFFDRISPNGALNIYQNMLILGVSKAF